MTDREDKTAQLLMPETPTEEMLDAVTAGVCNEWRPYRRQQALKLYLAFVASVKTTAVKESDV